MTDKPDTNDVDALLGDLTVDAGAAEAPAKPRRDLSLMLRKIPVTLTLEVGSADVSLDQLMGLEHGSVVELDALAGSPLVIKVNGTAIGRAEVVVSGENYGLKVLELSDLDLLSLDTP
ncbi:FliM/FliN family flagellar motor switch protein [Pseudorhodoferax sp. Leaf265]|jgi:flagellar motor switch protein FliN/FliY|uniref:FliM/FliN family flagellar motor switch protein n=1 Tax=Pseudorhodoferax sp. Leaf265 TaxID=1736315 RepID=UPI0006F7E3FD|nr:FliM/FliN family flagellar motor switch protein [Pseudorhodoferax sp. Leaf265]KQP06480.1 flagellar motor switch protein FliN [Pseudorhodoferax sp. Leaf265]PZQ03264.1 MAG: flagellar motor switch protein FliN [Variovorax paradoxus]PZQ17538.1 MAG: flagellar motor switch protein FliN [Variovorax paradoxus]